VTTSDGRASVLVSDPTLDASLTALFAVDIPVSVLDGIDHRIQHGLRTWSPRPGRMARFRPGRRAGVIAVLAASLAVGGANGSLRALYVFVAGPFDLPWHRGVELNLSQTVDGYRVTLDRAYADATRLALAISVVDERRRPGTTQLEAFSAVVTDASGEYGGLGAVSNPDGPYAAVNVAWKTPAALPLPSGPRAFHVVLPFIQVRDDSIPPPNADEVGWNPWHRVAGPWTFDFEMVVDGGTTVTPNAVADANGIRATVTRLIAAPSIVRVDLRIDGTPGASGWNPVGEVRHDGQVMKFVVGSFEPDGTIALMTDGGAGDASGRWTVTFNALAANDDPNGPMPPTNPWVVEFDVP
jgi:hypothetical protein